MLPPSLLQLIKLGMHDAQHHYREIGLGFLRRA